MSYSFCIRKAGHAGRCRLVTASAHRRVWGEPIARGITPTEPPCIQRLIDRREADVRAGRLVAVMSRKGGAK